MTVPPVALFTRPEMVARIINQEQMPDVVHGVVTALERTDVSTMQVLPFSPSRGGATPLSPLFGSDPFHSGLSGRVEG